MTLSRKNGLAISFLHSTLYIKTPVAYDMWNYSPRLGSLGGVIDYWREEAAIWQIETHRKS
jgi:hypothetical protein